MDHAPSSQNGIHVLQNGAHEPTLEDLEQELPVVFDGQIPLGDLVQRVVQKIYAELTELSETLPSMSDQPRKRSLADWVVATKKQVVKLYAVVKWSRDADTVQKCMNITAFLMNQNQQFENAMIGLKYAKDSLDPARLRNHDLLTSLDVLTTGSYRRLPSGIRKLIVPPTPLTDPEVRQTFSDMEDAIRYRLRMSETIPVEMSRYRIADGRVFFTVPKLFETSLCLAGALKEDGWFFVHVEFLITIGGELNATQEFPRIPSGIMKQHITNEADARLNFYLPGPLEPEPLPPGVKVPVRPQLAPGVTDAPLVRMFNFLQMMSLSYQLETLCYQAMRMRLLGWADFMKIEMIDNRKTLIVSYWIRPATAQSNAPRAPGKQVPIPLLGGTLSIRIVETHAPTQAGGGPARTPKARVLAELQQLSKLGATSTPSDQVEGLKFEVRWVPAPNALGADANAADTEMGENELFVNSDDLDLESMLRKVIDRHTKAILSALQRTIQLQFPTFRRAGVLSLVFDGNLPALRVHICAEEVVLVTIDPRTGRLSLRDTGDLAAAGRGPKFQSMSIHILATKPETLPHAINKLQTDTVQDLAEQKAKYLGLRCFKSRNLEEAEWRKLGRCRSRLFIQLSNFPTNYLVLLITEEEFRYALVTVEARRGSPTGQLIMKDVAWLDVKSIHGQGVVVTPIEEDDTTGKRKRGLHDEGGRGKGTPPGPFDLETQVLRELYAYCCARVAHMKVEMQFKIKHIPIKHVKPEHPLAISTKLAHVQSAIARSVPSLCVQSSDILLGAPAAEAAMPNIRVIPLNWWSEKKKIQVVTCVKLKYVQQPIGKRATSGSSIIRPSKRIIYDSAEAVVSFLSENVDTCVDEFLEEWARVSKMVVIAREVAQMAKSRDWPDVRLLSFDLQTVEFAYAQDYVLSLTCLDQLLPTTAGVTYDLRFSRCGTSMEEEDSYNPHDDAEPFMRALLQGPSGLATSLHRLVSVLRDTLPIVVELENIRREAEKSDQSVDTFAKSAGWYRILYGDLNHALDFRLMSEQRVAILDASHSLFRTSPTVEDTLGLQPIPKFKEMISDVMKELEGSLGVGTTTVDVGIVCSAHVVRMVGRALHGKILDGLKC